MHTLSQTDRQTFCLLVRGYSIRNNILDSVAFRAGNCGRGFCYVSKVHPSILSAFLPIWTCQCIITKDDLLEFMLGISRTILGFLVIIGTHCSRISASRNGYHRSGVRGEEKDDDEVDVSLDRKEFLDRNCLISRTDRNFTIASSPHVNF